jgi:putative nucleotidyltransferase with HDIG domain
MPGEELRRKLESTRELPTLPVVLMPLLHELDQPIEAQDMHEVVRLISQDKSLAAQCLHLVNSPLFGCTREVESIQAAVVALGLERIREIAVSCSMLKLVPTVCHDLVPSVFWAHSLGCALVSRDLAQKIGFSDPAKAYAAGLLHDVGIVALLSVAPREFRSAVQCARAEHIPLYEAEAKTLGLTHTDAGTIIAEAWHLPRELIEAIAYHHLPQAAPCNPALASIVFFSDLLCRFNGIGHGVNEKVQASFSEEPAYAVLGQHCSVHPFDWARFTFEMEAVVEEVHAIVTSVYGSSHERE